MSSVCHSVKITHLTVLQNHMHIVHHRGTVPSYKQAAQRPAAAEDFLDMPAWLKSSPMAVWIFPEERSAGEKRRPARRPAPCEGGTEDSKRSGQFVDGHPCEVGATAIAFPLYTSTKLQPVNPETGNQLTRMQQQPHQHRSTDLRNWRL